MYYLKTHYSYLLREFAINQYIKNTSTEILVEDIFDMLDYYNKHNPKKMITIHEDFPSKKLVEIMKHYLHFFLHSKHSCIEHVWLYSNLVLEIKLTCFYNFNPFFGRKKYVRNYINGKHKYSVVFNEKHVRFCKDGNFINSHIL
jgi:hypothetical protein